MRVNVEKLIIDREQYVKNIEKLVYKKGKQTTYEIPEESVGVEHYEDEVTPEYVDFNPEEINEESIGEEKVFVFGEDEDN